MSDVKTLGLLQSIEYKGKKYGLSMSYGQNGNEWHFCYARHIQSSEFDTILDVFSEDFKVGVMRMKAELKNHKNANQ